jgi:hypothetical protein
MRSYGASLAIFDEVKRWVCYYDVTYWKRRGAGWLLTTHGAPLGIIAPAPRRPLGERWSARVLRDAFRGSGPADHGHVNDVVPADLYNHDEPIAWRQTKDEAARAILAWASERRAPLLGNPRHPDVTPFLRRQSYDVAMFDMPTRFRR